MRLFAGIRTRPAVAGMVRGWARSTGLVEGALRGGALPADDVRENANLAGAWSTQPVPASPPRAAVTGLPPRVPRARRRGAPAATPAPRQQPLGRAHTRAAGRGEG
jgi:hypothetical protein